MADSKQTYFEQSVKDFYSTWRYLPDMRTKQPAKPKLLTIDDLDVSKPEKPKRKRKKRKKAAKKKSTATKSKKVINV